MIKQIFGIEGFSTDISFEACLRAKELFNVDGLTVNASTLPFKDNAFDLVICSEVIEHLEYPLFALKELLRITKKYLLITTCEVEPFQIERSIALKTRDLSHPHAERNYYHPDDFKSLYGNDVKMFGQHRILGDFPQQKISNNQTKDFIKKLTNDIEVYDFRYNGIIVLKSKDGQFDNNPKLTDDKILDLFLEIKVKENHQSFPYNQAINNNLFEKTACPICKNQNFNIDEKSITCKKCNEKYSIEKGTPEMFRVVNYPQNELNDYFDKKTIARLQKKLSFRNIIKNPFLLKLLTSYKNRKLHSMRKKYIVNF